MQITGPPVWLVLLRGTHDAMLISLVGSLACTLWC
jgi:hypothetical protein